MPRLLVTLRAPIAIDANWKLRTDTRVMEVRPASDTERDQCQLTFLGIDVTERVAAAAFEFLAVHTYQMDSIVASVDTMLPGTPRLLQWTCSGCAMSSESTASESVRRI